MQPDRFYIQAIIGRNPTGPVFKAFDQTHQREVAIKDLRTSPGNATELLPEASEALRDAAAAAQLDHPGIARVWETLDDPPWIIMEYVDGDTLSESMAGDEPKTLEWRLQILKQAAEALDFAHSRHCTHGDVKPEHLLVAAPGDDGKNRVKIIGFGIGKLTCAYAARTLSGEQRNLDALRYMAPEQIASPRNAGAAADQYSLAVIAYELLTGERPFRSETVTTLAEEVRRSQPPPPSSFNQDLDKRVDAVLYRALAQEPQDRFPSCLEFINALSKAVLPDHNRFFLVTASAAVLAALAAMIIYVLFFRPHPAANKETVAAVQTQPIATPDPPPPPVEPPAAVTPPTPVKPPAAVTPPTPVKPRPPTPTRYGLQVFAGGEPVAQGITIPEDDPRLLELTYTVTYSNVRRNSAMKVFWSVDGDTWAEHNLAPTEPSGVMRRQFKAVALPGAYRMWLLVGDREEQVLTFTVAPVP